MLLQHVRDEQMTTTFKTVYCRTQWRANGWSMSSSRLTISGCHTSPAVLRCADHSFVCHSFRDMLEIRFHVPAACTRMLHSGPVACSMMAMQCFVPITCR